MGKIFCLMGKSATGKDTIYKKLTEDQELLLRRLVPYTTRPIRDGESEGRESGCCIVANIPPPYTSRLKTSCPKGTRQMKTKKIYFPFFSRNFQTNVNFARSSGFARKNK